MFATARRVQVLAGMVWVVGVAVPVVMLSLIQVMFRATVRVSGVYIQALAV